MRVAILLFLLFYFLPAPAQTSPQSVWDRCVALYQQGKLDSIQGRIVHDHHCTRMDSSRWFYVCTDTFYFPGGIYSTGKMILDPFLDFYGVQAGEWRSFYPDGRLLSNGEYGISYYCTCQGGAPGINGYSFRQNQWTFRYPDGSLMATGRYNVMPLNVDGYGWLNYSFISNDWQFFDTCGNRVQITPGLKRQLKTDYHSELPPPGVIGLPGIFGL